MAPIWIEALGAIILANLGGWLHETRDADSAEQSLEDSARRALRMGAKK